MPSDGYNNAEIAVLEDFPNDLEVRNSRLYVGGTSYTYDTMLKSAGLNRNIVYTTCMIERTGYSLYQFYNDKDCTSIKSQYSMYKDLLERKLLSLPNLKVIVPVGKGVLQTLCGVSPLAKWRGSVLPVLKSFSEVGNKRWKVVPTFSPREINFKYSERLFSTIDFKRAKEECHIGGIQRPNRKIIVAPSFEQASNYMLDIINNKLRVATDIECTPSVMTCISFAKSPFDGISVPFYNDDMSYYWESEEQAKRIEELVQAIINDPTIPKVLQNGMFDFWYLGNKGYKPQGLDFDTMNAAHLQYCELPKDLGTLVSIYTKEPYYKFERTAAKKEFDVSFKPIQVVAKKSLSEAKKLAKKRSTVIRNITKTELLKSTPKRLEKISSWKEQRNDFLNRIRELMSKCRESNLRIANRMVEFTKNASLKYWTYNAKDSLVTLEIALKQEEELKERGLWDFFQEFYVKVFPIVYDMSLRGIRVDDAMRSRIETDFIKELESLRQELYDIVGYEFNTASSAQMAKVLYETLGFDKIYSKNKTLTTDAKALAKLKDKYDNPALDIIFDIRALEKLISTYLRSKLDNGYMRSTISVDRTTSGRYSSSKSPGGSGGNLQNIPSGKKPLSHRLLKAFNGKPKLIRDCFIVPSKDYRFIAVDLSSADTWFTAFRAGDKVLMNALLNGEDTHVIVAGICFEKALEAINKTERNAAKPIGHGFNYGMQPRSMAINLKMPLAVVKKMYNNLEKSRPAIPAYHRWVENEIITKHKLVNAWGRPRIFLDRTPFKMVCGKRVIVNSEIYRSGYSYIPQSSVADTISHITKRIFYKLQEFNCSLMRIALQVHDELIFEVHKDFIEEALPIIHWGFNVLQNPWGDEFTIPWDYSIGTRWGSLKELPVIEGKIDTTQDGEWTRYL